MIPKRLCMAHGKENRKIVLIMSFEDASIMELVLGLIFVTVQVGGQDMIAQHLFASKNASTMETVHIPILVHVNEVGVVMTVQLHYVHKNAIMVEYALLQTNANVTSGKIHGGMVELKEESQCFRSQTETHSLLAGRTYSSIYYDQRPSYYPD